MEWVVKLEAKSGWGEVETIEVGKLERRVVGLTAEEVGLTLSEGKGLLGELTRLVLQTQMEEFATCARVCRDCMKLRRRRDNRTRKIQTLFGTITVDAPRISVCPCQNDWVLWMSPCPRWQTFCRTDARQSFGGYRPN